MHAKFLCWNNPVSDRSSVVQVFPLPAERTIESLKKLYLCWSNCASDLWHDQNNFDLSIPSKANTRIMSNASNQTRSQCRHWAVLWLDSFTIPSLNHSFWDCNSVVRLNFLKAFRNWIAAVYLGNGLQVCLRMFRPDQFKTRFTFICVPFLLFLISIENAKPMHPWNLCDDERSSCEFVQIFCKKHSWPWQPLWRCHGQPHSLKLSANFDRFHFFLISVPHQILYHSYWNGSRKFFFAWMAIAAIRLSHWPFDFAFIMWQGWMDASRPCYIDFFGT